MFKLTEDEKKENFLSTWGRIQCYLIDEKKKNKRLSELVEKLDDDLIRLQIQNFSHEI